MCRLSCMLCVLHLLMKTLHTVDGKLDFMRRKSTSVEVRTVCDHVHRVFLSSQQRRRKEEKHNHAWHFSLGQVESAGLRRLISRSLSLYYSQRGFSPSCLFSAAVRML